MKKTKTWFITCIYLQLIFICLGSPCGNPVTDAINDIEKLVGNLPNDYIMTLKYVPLNQNLPKHCWLYVMVNEVSSRLPTLISKFSNSSQNYLILNNLSWIFQGIRICIHLGDQTDFLDEYSQYQEGQFSPQIFFSYVTRTIEVFKEINNTDYDRTCVALEDENDYSKPGLPYVPSKRENSSRIGSSETVDVGKGSPLQWTTIASIALPCLVIGFLFGVVCWWKVKHREVHNDIEVPVISVETKEDNELKKYRKLSSISIDSYREMPTSSSVRRWWDCDQLDLSQPLIKQKKEQRRDTDITE
ncbi:kit ligand [Rhinophrynus dorsalis]